MLKKAAMFGLDSRITIIIFVAISSIGFASFYNAINKTTATNYITDMKFVIQAYQNFKNDTQYQLTKYSNPYYYNISELVTLAVDNNKPYTKKYNGPYLEYNTTGTNNIIEHPTLGNKVSIVSRSFKNNWATQAHPDTAGCTSTDCFKWVVFTEINKDLADAIDKEVDNSLNANEGIIRIKNTGTTSDVFMAIEAE